MSGVLAVLLASLLFQQAPRIPATTGIENARATIRGRVLLADGRPVVRAQLRLTGSLLPTRYATTSDDGSYEFAYLLSGSYRLHASKTGYVALEFGQGGPADAGQLIAITAGETRDRVDIILPRHGGISGRIVDEAGDPIDGARVNVLQIRFAAGRRQLIAAGGSAATRTNDLGRYRVYGLPPGRYFVRAEVGAAGTGDLPGYTATYFPGTPTPSDAQSVTLGVSEEAANVDFAMALGRTARIAGTTLDSAGEPYPARIEMRSSRRSSVVDVGAVGGRTYPDGRFEFPNVGPGEYVIDATSVNDHALQFVSVSGADVTGLVLQTAPGSRVSGRVVFEGGEPINRREVLLSVLPVDPDLSPFDGSSRRAGIGLDDSFEFAHLIGPHRFHLAGAPAGWALKVILVDGVDAADRVFPFGTSDQSLRNVEVVLTTMMTEVSGTILDRRAPAASGAVVVFAADRSRWYEGSRFLALARITGGTFTVRGLPPDEYVIAAVERLPGADADNEWQDPQFLEGLVTRATRVVLGENQKASVGLSLPSR